LPALPSLPIIAAFIVRNWPLALVFVISGAMLLWPLLQRRLSPAREIGTLDATRLLNNENPLVLDVREANELAGGRLPNALHIPLSQLKDRGAELAKHVARPVIVYCDRGVRGGAAIAALTRLGFTRVQSLRGGLRAWKDAGLPLSR
jgi:rhodanese-related sulfurtransferase